MNIHVGEFSSLDALLREQVEIASILEYLVSPFQPQFTDKVALFCAGIEWSVIRFFYMSQRNLVQRYMTHQKFYLRQCCGTASKICDDESVKLRYKFFTQFAQRWPSAESLNEFEKDSINFDPLQSFSGIERAAAIRLVGGNPKLRKLDQALYRFDSKTFSQKGMRGRLYAKEGATLDPKKDLPIFNDPLPHTQPRHVPIHVMHNTITNLTSANDHAPTISVQLNDDELTNVSSISTPSIAVPTSSFDRLSLSSSSTITSMSATVASGQPTAAPSDSTSRKTARQANVHERREREKELCRGVAFKAATVFVDAYKDGQLNYFSSVNEIIDRVNEMFGMKNDPLILSQEVITAVKKGKINELPPKLGRNYKLGKEIMDCLSDLYFSHNAISQHNVDGQLSRQQYISMLQTIVGPKEQMNWRHLNKEIEIMNCHRQVVNTIDSRQALRVQWFSTQNLIKHYENFEEEMVKLKCARWATEEELETCSEKIKWFDDQRARVINGDEMSFGLDTDSNNIGGRPAMNYSADGVRDAGEADHHSSTRMTIFCAMTYNDEVLPPLIILTATGYTKRLEADLLSRFHHIEGQWGHSQRRSFSPYIAASCKGSMSAEILQGYLLHVSQLYPGMSDVDKMRVIWKLDNGVGRDNAELNHLARSMGYVIYPGLPNSSEGTQECDQFFSTFKSKLEKNRQLIVYHNKSVSMFDLPFILFGGSFKCKNGNTIELVNAFESSFTVEHCRSARRKCGYCPATRCALFHQKCRRVLGDNLEEMNIFSSARNSNELVSLLNHADDQNLQQCEDGDNAYTSMMLDVESMNASSCKKLIELGFTKAKLLKQPLKRDNDVEAQMKMQSICTYLPGSRERQEQMMKARYPGEYFAITSGGAPNNCDDMLISMQLNQLSKDAERLQKKKEGIINRRKNFESASEILTRPNSTKQKGPLTNAELKICIQWKKEMDKPPKGKQNELRKQWEECKDSQPPAEPTWTTKNERKLQLAQSGEIGNFKHSRQFKIAHVNKCIYLKSQIGLLQRNNKLQLLLSLYESLPMETKHEFAEQVKLVENGAKMAYSCFEYNSDDDDDESLASSSTNSSFDSFIEAQEIDKDPNTTETDSVDIGLSFESMLDQQENSSPCDGGCASGKYCRCPWEKSRFAHTCTECKKPVHSFCFGFNEEGGKSKCALCVFPNRVCQYSMQFDPGSGPPSSDTSPVLDDSSDSVLSILNKSETGNVSILNEDSNDTFDEHQSVHTKESEVSNSDSPYLSLLGSTMSAQDGNSSFEIDAEVVTATTTSMEQDNSNKIQLVLDDDDSNDEENKENTKTKKFEDMNEDELKNEFLKRNMKVGRITKKATFIARLTKCERANEKKK